MCFTGYALGDLRAMGRDVSALLKEVDLLVDGPYIAEQAEPTRALVGSTNQRFLHLTERYRAYEPEVTRNRIELRITTHGTIQTNGFLTTTDLSKLSASLNARRHNRSSPRGSLDQA